MEYGQIVKFNGGLGEVVTDNGKFYFLPVNYGQYTCSRLEEITDATVEPATFEEKIRFIEYDFGWGTVVKTHTIGEYQIIEYVNKEIHHFSSYVNFKSCHTSNSSLEAALINAISINSIEVNEARYATTCILRILKKQDW